MPMREPDDETLRTTVTEAQAGSRLDRAVAQLADLSVNAARRLLATGAVRVNGRAVAAGAKGQRVNAGDTIEAPRQAIEPLPVSRPDLPLEVLAEGEGYVAVNKPAGVGTHPLDPSQSDTVLNRVVARFPGIVGVGEGGLRSGVVHRLDLPTTGVLLLATTGARFDQLREAFTQHTLRKTYHALVRGRLTGQGEQTMPLAITRHRPARVEVVPPDHPQARACSLAWRTVETFTDATLVEVDLHTGFLHQVRVMLAVLGHPLLGDDAYGDGAGALRVMLHAAAITFADIDVRCDPPDDFVQLLTTLRTDHR
jgi:23S rRNA pseudouridine1911/1915/1917 synthase